jgi:hypothetical protein
VRFRCGTEHVTNANLLESVPQLFFCPTASPKWGRPTQKVGIGGDEQNGKKCRKRTICVEANNTLESSRATMFSFLRKLGP